jgi:hypothetical protein
MLTIHKCPKVSEGLVLRVLAARKKQKALLMVHFECRVPESYFWKTLKEPVGYIEGQPRQASSFE